MHAFTYSSFRSVAAINHTADHTIWCFFLTKQYTTDIYLQQQYAISSQMQLQTRSSDEKAVCLSVRLSVCQRRGLWQNGRKICPDFYTIRKIISHSRATIKLNRFLRAKTRKGQKRFPTEAASNLLFVAVIQQHGRLFLTLPFSYWSTCCCCQWSFANK